ncbi:MAG TPA: XRE family transcriptional regulator [Longimicrobium sp.]
MSEAQTTPGRAGTGLLFSPVLTASLEHRRSLTTALVRVLECRRLGAAETAALLGIGEPRVRVLMRGDADAFSIEELVRLLAAVGIDV